MRNEYRPTAEDLRAAAPALSPAAAECLDAWDTAALVRACDGYDTAEIPAVSWEKLSTPDRTAIVRNLEARGLQVGHGLSPSVYWGCKAL